MSGSGIGRIRWEAVELKSDFRTGGEKLVELSDVFIERIDVRRRDQIEIEVISSFGPGIGERMTEALAKAEETIRERSREEDVDRIAMVFFKKKIALNDVFCFGLGTSLDPDRGIGLFGNKTDERTFSWDWFNVEEPGLALKIQEMGELSYTTLSTDNGMELAHLRFKTDVSLRMSRGDADARDLSWRINVGAGSEIFWPFLSADGSLVPTGYLSEP